MNVNIITVFKTENCGSFLQAWALKETLSKLGQNVYFCNYKSPKIKKTIVTFSKCVLKFHFKRAMSVLKKHIGYNKLIKKIKIAKHESDNDCYIFGSDTLWNFDDAFFAANSQFFTGGKIEKPCYTYAMSLGSTSKEVLLKDGQIVKNIQKFKKIAVRDDHAEQVLSEVYPIENIVRTIDPTMLIEKERYLERFFNKKLAFEKSLVIYYFGTIPKELFDNLKAFATKKGLKIIYIGYYDSEFDLSFTAIPENFITLFNSAEYIFTNTFHGCVFSTIFNKQFATNGINKKKIEGFLKEFLLTERSFSEPTELEKVFEKPIDYLKINNIIEKKRQDSFNYLKSIIDEENIHE